MAAPDTDELESPIFEEYLRVIHRLTGITIAPNRKSMLQGRVRPRLRALGLSYADYLRHVETDVAERQLFVDAVTTNETYFYRTPRVWEHLMRELLPTWFKANPGKTFRAWSAAASSGEEAHTLGIVLQDFQDRHPGFQWEVAATDLCQEVLATARKGLYSGRAIESFRKAQPELCRKYMRPAGGEQYSAAPEIRERLKFKQHHLFQRPAFAQPFDLVFLRNVLIYFTAPDQEKVLAQVSVAMRPDSTLIIGESESLNRLATPFEYLQPLVYRNTGRAGKAAA